MLIISIYDVLLLSLHYFPLQKVLRQDLAWEMCGYDNSGLAVDYIIPHTGHQM